MDPNTYFGMKHIYWEYQKEDNWWELYINNLYMGIFDNHDYHKQRKILHELEATQVRKLEVTANGHNIDATIIRVVDEGCCIVMCRDRIGKATRVSLEDNIWTLAPVEQCIDLLSM